MSDEARKQRRDNVVKARASGMVKVWRCNDESVIIRQLIRQWAVAPEPKLSGRALARKLKVRESYVRRLATSEGVEIGRRVTWDDLDAARIVTESLRLANPGLFATPRASAEPQEPTPTVHPRDPLDATAAHAAVERFREEHQRKWPHLYRQ
jgi:hypothetical protein